MSKIEVHHSLVVARKVVSALEKIIPSKIAKDCRIKSWSNCREQGLCLEQFFTVNGTLDGRKVVFAENRNSDEIVVIHGDNYDFDIQTNQPNDEVWSKNHKFFKPGDYNGVAKYILGIISA